ncbi:MULTISPECIES: hypothetical protein [unclassified Curtobacterium]|uniref:hypothetical protein n=1 Tax=unclassified Curtobacterium TaxID=257496 RepID=UPI0011B77225|nr:MULTISPECIES: hypothetical protein [unclassified Curtobacterium]WIE54165.1 hypothetical protein DEI88_013725 [Curtobacterium sp. MCBD17_003]
MPRRRGPRADLAAARDDLSPVLLDGDAGEVVAALEAFAHRIELPIIRPDRRDELPDDVRCPVAVLAVRNSGRRSSLRRAIDVLRAVEAHLTPDAVVVAVSTSSAARSAPARLQRQLSAEILYQVRAAVSPAAPRSGRSFRLRLGLSALGAVGVQVFRIALSG